MIRAELLSPDGDVLSRVHLEDAATVGSGRGCALVLADASVAPVHLEVGAAPDGTIRLRHRGGDAVTRVGALVVGGDAEVRSPAVVAIGDVLIRLTVEEPPPSAGATSAATATAAAEGPETPRVLPAKTAWVLLAGAALVVAVEEYVTTYQADPWRQGLTVALAAVAGLLVWAGGWALGNRIFGHRASFSTHLGVVSGWLLAATPFWLLLYGLDQAVHVGVTKALETGFDLVVAAVLLYLHIRVASRRRRSVNLALAAGVVLGFTSLSLLADDSDPATDVEASLSTVAALPEWVFVARPAESVDRAAEALIAELDDLEARRSVEPPE